MKKDPLPLIVSFDTSTHYVSIAVMRGDMVCSQGDFLLERAISEQITGKIDQVLRRARVSLKEVDCFAVGLGPGSFTGLRVGLATLKGIAFALRKPVVGIASLDVMALGIKARTEYVCAVSDARRELVYAALYKSAKGELKRVTEYLLVEPQVLLQKITREVTFVGDGIPCVKEALKAIPVPHKTFFVAKKFWRPQMQYAAPAIVELFREARFDAVATLVPLYLYPEDCQVEKSRKKV